MAAQQQLAFTPLQAIPKIVAELREEFDRGTTRPLEFRKQQLHNLLRLLHENEEALVAAVRADLHKAPLETCTSEIGMAIGDTVLAIDNLEDWARPTKVSSDIIFAMDNPQVRHDPLGLVLIIGAWNYPVQLTLVPIVGAIAAGNTVVLKPSELSQATASLLAALFPKYLDQRCYRVVNGAVEETTELLRHRWDHIFYTGNGHVGRIVAKAAAEHLTPITLELGGKSPVILDSDVDMDVAARRITWGRYYNAGQTCVAPDYVLLVGDKSQEEKFVSCARKALKEFYGDNPKTSEDYGRIVNGRHFKRLKALLDHKENGDKALGGETDEDDRYIAPTIMTGVSPKSPIMQDEIFGPILPVLRVGNVEEAIRFVNQRDKPLALYVFSNNSEVVEKVLSNTTSGGAIANDCLMHAACSSLPFGGVGPSGCGAYHGRLSFETFSHARGMLVKSLGMESVNAVRYPPYTAKKLSMLKFFAYKSPTSAWQRYLKVGVVAGVAAVAALYLYSRVNH
jgi:acyl-CoA reductase-like NAD-dependent aldehyde dehydrogenase